MVKLARRRSRGLLVAPAAAAVLGLALVPALPSGVAAAPAAKHCGTAKAKGFTWKIGARGVSCSYAKSWLPKMLKAHQTPGGSWSGPSGWTCVRYHQIKAKEPTGSGPIKKGLCGTKSGQEMVWERV